MNVIAAKKCVRHPAREAVARCQSCAGDFCRECVIEHTGILLCSTCIAKEAATAQAGRRAKWSRLYDLTLTAACVFLLAVAFYCFGQFLKMIPPKVHEGTVWQSLTGS